MLERADLTAEAAIEHLVGMQAQAPLAPYVGLWSRLAAFDTADLAALLTSRRVVRISLLRVTVHLVTARDALAIRPIIQPIIERTFLGSRGSRLAGVDPATIAAAALEVLAEGPITGDALGKRLAERWPAGDAEALGTIARATLPLVQLPPRGIWGKGGLPTYATIEQWLGQSLAAAPSIDRLVLRYLGAYGPASVADMQTWSRLTRLREVIDRLRPGLRVFRNDAGTEIFDLPDAPRPDPATPAPPRFVPEYDNLLLSHADRTRIIADADRARVFTVGGALLDGFVAGSWKIRRSRGSATLVITPFRPISPAERADLADEGARLLAFAAAGTIHDIQFSD